MGREVGIELNPWQASVMDDWMAVGPDRLWTHPRCVLQVPRQNGKTALVELRIIIGAVGLGESFLYTAHDYSTVTQLFDRLQGYFGERANDPEAKFPKLNRMVKSVRKAIAKEAIFLKNGAAIYLSTRTKAAKRGYTVDVVIVDESQALVDEHSKAIMPTKTAAPKGNPQAIYLGTPPGPEYPGAAMTVMRRRARSGADVDDLTWSEWGIEDLSLLDDRATWRRVNPSIGYQISERSVETLRREFTEDLSFAQECLGYWLPDGRTADRAIPEGHWAACRTAEPPEPSGDERVCYAVKFSADGSRATLAAAARQPDGTVLAEVPEGCSRATDGGIAFFEDWLVARAAKASQIVVDGKSSAGDLAQRLRDAKVPRRCLVETSPAQVAEACGALVNRVAEHRLLHTGQPAVETAVAHAEKRPIGSGGGHGFACEAECADATIPEALALAAWAAAWTKRRPGKGARLL